MDVLLIAVAVIVGLPLLLLAVPVRVAFRVARADAFSGKIAIHWMFGWLHVLVRIPDARQAPHSEAPGKPEKPKKLNQNRSRSRSSGRSNAMALFWRADFRQRVYRLVRDVGRAAHLHRLRLRMRLGLGDPADTGQLWAVLGPLSALAQGLRGADVHIEPAFMESVFEFHARGRLRVIPLQFLALALAFVLSPVCIRAWRSLQRGPA
jgi:hypothetical protein